MVAGGLVLVVIVVIAAAFVFGGGLGGSATPSPAASVAARGENCPTSQPAALPAGQTRTVTITTTEGDIVVQVKADLSPIAAGNFVALASCRFYDGLVFHRVVPDFVIQGGDPKGDGSGGPGYTIADEPVTATYGRGTVAMARSSKPNSQGSQFFIVLSDDAKSSLASANTYAIFGTVVTGMDVVDTIASDADAENPTNPIEMVSVTVANP
jgi:cyclophilin family peptidyl-prolyl cis-trans isomerase